MRTYWVPQVQLKRMICQCSGSPIRDHAHLNMFCELATHQNEDEGTMMLMAAEAHKADQARTMNVARRLNICMPMNGQRAGMNDSIFCKRTMSDMWDEILRLSNKDVKGRGRGCDMGERRSDGFSSGVTPPVQTTATSFADCWSVLHSTPNQSSHRINPLSDAARLSGVAI